MKIVSVISLGIAALFLVSCEPVYVPVYVPTEKKVEKKVYVPAKPSKPAKPKESAESFRAVEKPSTYSN